MPRRSYLLNALRWKNGLRLASFSILLGFIACTGTRRTTSVTCDSGKYLLDGTCTEVGVGYYSESNERKECTNAPTNSHYTSTVASSADCPWDCENDYLVNNEGTGCNSRANTVLLACETNEIAVGVYGRTGWWMDKLGVRCASFTDGVIGSTISDGAATGGSGGDAFTYDCPAGSVLVQVKGKNGTPSGCSPSSTGYHQYSCMNLTTLTVTDLSSKYGESNAGTCPAQTAFDYSCPSGRYAYGITVDADGTGTYVGFTLGTNCR